MCVAKEELQTLLEHPDIASKDIPIVFFANKVGKKMRYILRPMLVMDSPLSLLLFVRADGYPWCYDG